MLFLIDPFEAATRSRAMRNVFVRRDKTCELSSELDELNLDMCEEIGETAGGVSSIVGVSSSLFVS